MAPAVARLAVARLLRARVVDIASVLGGRDRGKLPVLGVGHATDISHRNALVDALASGSDGGEERLVIMSRAAAVEVFGDELATGAAALIGSQSGLAQSLIDGSAVDGQSGCAQAPVQAASTAVTTNTQDAVVTSPAAAWEAVPSLPLGDVATLLQKESLTQKLRRTAPPSVLRKLPPLSPSAVRLFDSVESCSTEAIRAHVAACHDIDLDVAHPDHGGTCLHVAAALASPSAAASQVTELCQHGASVDARAANASTPLHWAAGSGNTAAVSALLRFGADPTLESYTWRSNVFGKGSGQTPAHWAAESGFQNCVEALLRHGDGLAPFLADERGKLPSDLADREGHDEVFATLEAAAKSDMICLAVSTEASVHRVVSGKV